jgi:hypothetical protein
MTPADFCMKEIPFAPFSVSLTSEELDISAIDNFSWKLSFYLIKMYSYSKPKRKSGVDA